MTISRATEEAGTGFRLASARCAVLAAALATLPALQATAQSGGLGAAVAQPTGGDNVLQHMLDVRSRATRIDGETASRIYGGRPAKPGAWPAQVALFAEVPPEPGKETEDKFYAQFCGGSLIARQWVLTAAHCIFKPEGGLVDPAKIGVMSGSTKLGEGDFRAVAGIIPHEDYNPINFDNDIALIKLAEPVRETSGPVGAIKVIGQDQPTPEGPAVVIGWGFTEENKAPQDLLETDIDIVPNAVCNRGMAEQTKREFGTYLMSLAETNRVPMDKLEQVFSIVTSNLGDQVNENMICAGIPSGERTSCNGDSGGPLMVRQADGSWLQVGVVSWGRRPLFSSNRQACNHPQLYAVYTRLSRYFDWIGNKLASN